MSVYWTFFSSKFEIKGYFFHSDAYPLLSLQYFHLYIILVRSFSHPNNDFFCPYLQIFFLRLYRNHKINNVDQIFQQSPIKYSIIIIFPGKMTDFIEEHCYPAQELIEAILGNVSIEGGESAVEVVPTNEPFPELRTSLPSFEKFIEEIPSREVVYDQSLFFREQEEPQLQMRISEEIEEDQEYRMEERQQGLVEEGERRKEKNSNAIKKIGRIILDNLREYGPSKGNPGVESMLRLLSRNSKVGRTEVNKRDKFNTFHLRALLGGRGESSRNNLRTTRRILSRCLRSNVLLSRQISTENKLLYLNTMKCSALRCLHPLLAVRLQMAPKSTL